MKTRKKVFLSFLIYICLLQLVLNLCTQSLGLAEVKDDRPAADNPNPERIEAEQPIAESSQDSLTGLIQGGQELLRFSSSSASPSFSRHLMCKGHDTIYNPIEPTTTFSPSDTKAECLTTVSIDNSIDFRWYYRNDSSKTWIYCYNHTKPALLPGEYYYESHLLIAGHWPGTYYPRAYKVDVYLDGLLSFSEFFEVTNGGLNSPRMCENIDANGYAANMKSRFTIGVDTEACHYVRFDKMAYFNEEASRSHNFTTVWIQPDGMTYKTHSCSFADYKNSDVNSNSWNCGYIANDSIPINSSTAIGNWKVEVYIDSYYLNSTWTSYGPIATTPFVVGNESIADWTFMVYLDGDNRYPTLENASIDVFLNMADVTSSPDVNVVAQMDRTPGEDERYGNWTDCKRFNIKKGMTPTPENAILDLGEVDMGDPNTLRNFMNWTISNYPANRFFLVLWDHGAGVIGVCIDMTNGTDSLLLPELTEAMSGLPVTIDCVLIDACSMAMAEVACQIKDFANILIGPEGLGYAPAPYDSYLTSLTSNSSMSPNAFAREVVKDYIDWCLPIINIENATMSAIDLTKMTSLAAAIDDFAVTLTEKESLHHEEISLARNLTEGYPGPYADQSGYYIDLCHFAQLVYENVAYDKLGNASSQLISTLSAGNTIITQDQKNDPESHGLAIYFPDEKRKYDFVSDPYKNITFAGLYENTTFAVNTRWDEFVKYHLSGYVLTIQTTPPYAGLAVKVDEDSYTTQDNGKVQVFLPPGSHTVNITNIISPTPDSRGIFTQWKDGNSSNPRTFSIRDGELTAEAEYETWYRLIMDTDFGATVPTKGESWYKTNSPVNIQATSSNAVPGERYLWLGWKGKGLGSSSTTDNQTSITMNGPINETAVWRHEYYLTVTSSYGSPSPLSGWNESGSTISASVTSPFSGPIGTQYVSTGWTGTGSVQSLGIFTSTTFVLNMPSSIQWNWKTRYLLTVHTDPTGLSPQPNVYPEGLWYDNYTRVNCTAQQVNDYVFEHWATESANWDVGVNPITITMDGPYEVTAHYSRAHAWWEFLVRPDVMQVIVALLGTGLTASLVGGAWFRSRKRRNIVKAFLAEIDDVYSRNKTDPQKCEEELYRLRNTILEGLTDGKISEENYEVLDNRIDKYTKELSETQGPKRKARNKRANE